MFYRFGNAKHDDLQILAPLYQCCMIRRSTFDTLLQLEGGASSHAHDARLDSMGVVNGSLGERMRRSLADDPLDVILTDAHLHALDRRVKVILVEVNKCIVANENDINNVVIDDDGNDVTVRF